VSPGALQDPAVGLGVEAGVSHHDDPAEPPTVEVSLDLLDHVLVHGVPGPDPAPDRYPRPRHGEAHHDLGQVRPTVLTEAPPAEPVLPRVLSFDLEVSGRGVQEDEVDLEVEKVGHRGEDVELDLLLSLEEEVHGPVELVDLHLRQAVDEHLAGDPMLHRQLTRGFQSPVGHHGEYESFHRGCVATSGKKAP